MYIYSSAFSKFCSSFREISPKKHKKHRHFGCKKRVTFSAKEHTTSTEKATPERLRRSAPFKGGFSERPSQKMILQLPIYRSVLNRRTDQNSPFKGSRAKPGGVAFFVKNVCYFAEATPLSASLTFPLERGIFGFDALNSPINRNFMEYFLSASSRLLEADQNAALFGIEAA